MGIQLAHKLQPTRQRPPRKLNIHRLPVIKDTLQQQIQEALRKTPAPAQNDMEEEWSTLRVVVYTVVADLFGFVQRSHKDWFDENDLEITKLLDTLHKRHKDHISDKECRKKKDKYQ